MEKSAGIYRITIHRDGKPDCFYIGQAAIIGQRRRRHLNALRGGYHGNGRLQRDFTRYGEVAMSFEVLLVCEPAHLTLYEQLVLDSYDGHPIYNVQRQCVDTPLGTKRSPEARKRMAAAHLGKKLSEEHRAKIGAAGKGRKYGPRSAETRAKLSAASKTRVRKPHSEETRQKIGAAHRGKIVTAQTREKQSLAQQRRFASNQETSP